jgi:hypothetical protein
MLRVSVVPDKVELALRILSMMKAHVRVTEDTALQLRFWVSPEEAMLALEDIARLILQRESNSRSATA